MLLLACIDRWVGAGIKAPIGPVGAFPLKGEGL